MRGDVGDIVREEWREVRLTVQDGLEGDGPIIEVNSTAVRVGFRVGSDDSTKVAKGRTSVRIGGRRAHDGGRGF